MKATPKKRIHHYIPQWYLKKFAKNNSKKSPIFCINLKDGKTFKTTPKNIGAKRDFNRIDISNLDPDSLEDELAKHEPKMLEIIDNIEHEELFSFSNPDHKKYLLYFVALLIIRTPKMRNHWSKQMDHLYKTDLQAAVSMPVGSRINGQVITQELKDAVAKNSFRVVPTRHGHIKREFDMIDIILPLLHKRKWCIFKTTDDVNLITSDAPAILSWNDNTNGILSPGFALPNTTVLIPLSKKIVLAGSFDWHQNINYAPMETKIVALINTQILCFSNQFIYSPNPKFWFIRQDGSLSCNVDEIIKGRLGS